MPVLPTLDVVTGYGDDPRRTLAEGHRLYGLAHHAWLYQDDWPYDMWRSFWEALLPLWPHPDGAPKPPRERLERITAKLRRQGMTYAQIDAAICGYQPDTIRRNGVRRGAEEYAAGRGGHRMMGAAPEPGAERFVLRLEYESGSHSVLPLEALRVLPRVYSCENGDPVPPVNGYSMLRLTREQAGARPVPSIALTGFPDYPAAPSRPAGQPRPPDRTPG